jgi:hypothetical protein
MGKKAQCAVAGRQPKDRGAAPPTTFATFDTVSVRARTVCVCASVHPQVVAGGVGVSQRSGGLRAPEQGLHAAWLQPQHRGAPARRAPRLGLHGPPLAVSSGGCDALEVTGCEVERDAGCKGT